MNDDENRPDIEEVDMGQEGEIGKVMPDDVDVVKNNINDFIDAIHGQDFANAEQQFNNMVGDRLQATLDQAKIDIASRIYDAEMETDSVEDDDVEVEDEEIAVEN